MYWSKHSDSDNNNDVSKRQQNQGCQYRKHKVLQLQQLAVVASWIIHSCYMIAAFILASRKFTGSWNGNSSSPHGYHPEIISFHISHLFLNGEWNLPHHNVNFFNTKIGKNNCGLYLGDIFDPINKRRMVLILLKK